MIFIILILIVSVLLSLFYVIREFRNINVRKTNNRNINLFFFLILVIPILIAFCYMIYSLIKNLYFK